MAIILGKEPMTLRVVVDVDAGTLMGISLFQLRLLSRAYAQFAAATASAPEQTGSSATPSASSLSPFAMPPVPFRAPARLLC